METKPSFMSTRRSVANCVLLPASDENFRKHNKFELKTIENLKQNGQSSKIVLKDHYGTHLSCEKINFLKKNVYCFKIVSL